MYGGPEGTLRIVNFVVKFAKKIMRLVAHFVAKPWPKNAPNNDIHIIKVEHVINEPFL